MIRALVLVAAGVFLQGQEPVFRTANGVWELVGFDVAFDVKGLHGTVSGKPFRMTMHDLGIELAGQNAVVDGTHEDQGIFVLTSAILTGPATIAYDSQISADFAKELAKEYNLAIPRDSPDRSRGKLVTDSMTYKGDALQGTVTMPNLFVMTAEGHSERLVNQKAAKVPQIVDQSVEIHGNSGTATFPVRAKHPTMLGVGSIIGPITIHVVRKTTTAGKPDPTTDINASADRLDVDFNSPVHTMTMSGNVVLTGSADVYSGYTKASKAVLVFGADGNIERIEMTGTPTETKLKPRPRGGGL